MRNFSLLIGNETRGPLTEEEIAAMIAEGALAADTLCAPEGSQEWVPLSEHFRFGGKLKVKWNKPVSTEAEEGLAAARLDPDTRKLLLAYGLADAVSVDRFTQVQALLAIADHEKKVRATNRLHAVVGMTVLSAMVAVGTAIGLNAGPGGALVALGARQIIKEEVSSRANLTNLRNEIAQFADLKARATKAVFEKPRGGTPALNLIASRLQIDPATAFSLRGQADLSPLYKKIAAWGIKPDEDRRIYVLRETPGARALELLRTQESVLEEVLSAPLDEAGFAQLFAEAMTTFPAGTFTEAGLLRSEAAGMRMGGLRFFIERVDFHAKAAAGTAAHKQWCAELVGFSERLKALQAKVLARTSPEARRQRWSEFNAGQGAELATWVLTSGAKDTRLNADGTFTVKGVPSLNASTMNLVLVSTRIKGDTVFLPWGSKYLGKGNWTSETLPSAHLIDRERYKVVDKVTVGGRTYYAKLRTPTHTFVMSRSAPQWRYVAIARPTDKEPLFALVDERSYASAQLGTVLDLAALAKMDLYSKATESTRPEGLYDE
jgi:hypothetical protein